MPTEIRRRRRRRSKPLWRRIRWRLTQALKSSFKVNPGASPTSSLKERWQALAFTVALVVAMIAAFTIILLEDRPVSVQPIDSE